MLYVICCIYLPIIFSFLSCHPISIFSIFKFFSWVTVAWTTFSYKENINFITYSSAQPDNHNEKRSFITNLMTNTIMIKETHCKIVFSRPLSISQWLYVSLCLCVCASEILCTSTMESLAVGLPKIKVPQAHPGNSDEEDPQPRSSRPNIFPSCSISKFILTLAFIFLVSLTFGGIVFSLVWLTFKAETPTLWLNSLSVSKTKSSTLTTKYDVGFTYNNPNRIWEMEFDHVEVFSFHERTHCLASTTMERFHIGVKNEKCMNASLGDWAPCFGGDSVLEEIR